MITAYDYAIISCYFVFVIGVGLAFRGLSKNTSDYFRAGGAMPWWITGTSAWIASFSAWAFTGAAGKVYESGSVILLAFYPTAVALMLVYFYTSIRFRRMRVITWMEAVRNRYGGGTEQFYTWLKVPFTLLMAGVGLNAIGVFMSSVFDLPMNTILITLGLVVTLVALVGGAWAVLASDFVQMFLVVTITLVTAALTLAQPKIGGLSGLIRQVPASQFHWTLLSRPQVLLVWALAQTWFKFSDTNNMENATMYLMAKNDRNARRMVLIPIVGAIIGPLIWFIPPMASTITHPNLGLEFPTLPQPHEAAFVATARDVMPVGLMGLLICAMIGATLTSMDAGLNKNVGVFVRSFYCPLVSPEASEKHLLRVGKICTMVFGLIVVMVSLEVNKFRTVGLFQLTNMLAATLLMPMALPLVYGLFYRRTPGWSAWSTALVGFVAAYLVEYHTNLNTLSQRLGWGSRALSAGEEGDFRLGAVTLVAVSAGTIWYFSTSFFYRLTSIADRTRIDHFFQQLRTPIDQKVEHVENMDHIIYQMMGRLCVVFGTFVLILIAIPNTGTGRLCFVFCGGLILAVGLILLMLARRVEAKQGIATLALPTQSAGSLSFSKAVL